MFALAHAAVARWWDEALHWQEEEEEIWPHRLHRLAGGNAGKDLERWRIVGRDAAIFPEVVTVAQAAGADDGQAGLAGKRGDAASGAGR
ncbi:hypothetical protein [Streptomyces sp. NRRL S-1022]|uniref:hypothetical protein n=1 Tax=Streptomyces sp. NRRL S-1022 TaxID=1463880 RepID=UPI00068932BA|nr:hypothetical protein [Streptomyces sp. NRRL S-1022]